MRGTRGRIARAAPRVHRFHHFRFTGVKDNAQAGS